MTGATGASGASGATGQLGATGGTGSTGATGVQGASGATGAAGTSGSSGATGANGQSGATGSAGVTGATGTSGATGANGAQGATGGTGATGVAGSTGGQGATGTAGASGSTGAAGQTGSSVARSACTAAGPTQILCNATTANWLVFCDGPRDGRVYSCDGTVFVLVDNLLGATGTTGATGVAGINGATGATGALGPAEAQAADANWRRLALGSAITVNDVAPACYVDRTGDIALRGHVTLNPVPAIGGMLLGILPQNPDGSCPCTVNTNDIIGTTTGLAYSNVSGNVFMPDVCIVRLLVSRVLRYDVNRDFVISREDVLLVRNNPQYVADPTGASNCAPSGCGNVDVNQDGKVNQFDATAITEAVSSTRYPLSVACGGVAATAFSCGSTRASPLVPAVGISLDTVKYFNSDGTLTRKRGGRMDMRDVEDLLSRVATRDAVEHVEAQIDRVESKISSCVVHEEMQRTVSEVKSERAKVLHDHLLADIAVSVFVIAFVGLMAFLVRRHFSV